MTEVQRARIIVKIEELGKEKTEKEKILRRMESDHTAAWREYGSELCSGEMAADQIRAFGEITQIDGKIALLRTYLELNKDPRLEQQRLLEEQNKIELDTKHLEASKFLVERSLGEVSFVASVCNGEQ